MRHKAEYLNFVYSGKICPKLLHCSYHIQYICKICILLSYIITYIISPFGASTRFQVMTSVYGASRSHSDTPHSVELLWKVISPTQRLLPDNAQQLQRTDFHASGGIRTRNSSKRSAADWRLKPRNHRDRLIIYSVFHSLPNPAFL